MLGLPTSAAVNDAPALESIRLRVLPRDKLDKRAASIRMRIGRCCVGEGRRA